MNILLKVQKDVAGSLKAFREPRSLKQYREHTAYPSFTVFSINLHGKWKPTLTLINSLKIALKTLKAASALKSMKGQCQRSKRYKGKI